MNLVTFRNNSPAHVWESFFDSFPFSTLKEDAVLVPRVNIVDQGKVLNVSVELPGVPKEAIKVEVDEKVLTITAERKTESENKNDNVYVREFGQASYKRNFRLSDSLDASQIVARYENGVLELDISKKPQNEPKSIYIT